ncbi:hypothetical protein ACLB2K_063130 [Fragaria x ananassa]
MQHRLKSRFQVESSFTPSAWSRLRSSSVRHHCFYFKGTSRSGKSDEASGSTTVVPMTTAPPCQSSS